MIKVVLRKYKEETGADIVTNDSDIPDNYFESHKDNCNVVLNAENHSMYSPEETLRLLLFQ